MTGGAPLSGAEPLRAQPFVCLDIAENGDGVVFTEFIEALTR